MDSSATPRLERTFPLNGTSVSVSMEGILARFRPCDQAFASPRAITSRWIWFVPSKIWVILASRM